MLRESATSCEVVQADREDVVRCSVMRRLAANWRLITVLLLIVVAWWQTFEWMWLRWYPGWWVSGLSWVEKFRVGDSYYAHGPMVVLVSLAFAAFAYKRVGLPVKRTRLTAFFGGLFLIVSLLVHLVSLQAGVMFSSGFALIGVLLGMLLLCGGLPLLKAYGASVWLLVFMVPLPMVWIADANYALKIHAAETAVAWVNLFADSPATMHGSTVVVPAPDGVFHSLVIENVCSGLRSLIALTWFAAMMAVVLRVRSGWRSAVVVLALPLAVACNIARIGLLLLITHRWGASVVAEDTTLHQLIGVGMFVVAIAGLLGFEKLVLLVGNLLKRDWSDPGVMGFLNRIERSGVWRSQFVGMGTLSLLFVVAALSVWSGYQSADTAPRQVTWVGVPDAIELEQGVLLSRDLPVDGKMRLQLGTPDVLSRWYSAASDQHVALFVVHHQSDRQAIHPPEVCLVGEGVQVLSQSGCDVVLADEQVLPFKELITASAGRKVVHLYTYRMGGTYSTNFTTQQVRAILNRLWGDDRSVTLIRFSVPVVEDDVEAARGLALAAAGRLMPHVEAELTHPTMQTVRYTLAR